MSKKTNIKNSGPVPIRLPDEMKSRAAALAQKSGLSLADILRMSIERGVPKVEDMFSSAEKQPA